MIKCEAAWTDLVHIPCLCTIFEVLSSYMRRVDQTVNSYQKTPKIGDS